MFYKFCELLSRFGWGVIWCLCLCTFSSIKAQTFRNLFFNSFENIIRLDFATEPPTPVSTGIAGSYEAIAHYEDSAGNLLFMFNSNGVYDQNGGFMSGSFGILANSSSAEVSIAPVPGNPNRYYLFYNAETCSALYYSIIDMSLNGGLGNVVSLNTLISNVNHSEGMELVSIPGTNNYWLLTYRCGTGFTKYLVSPSGISTGTVFHPYPMPLGGYDGRGEFDYHKGRIGACFAWSSQVFLADFDPINGEVCNPVTLASTLFANNPYGVEFSPSANKMYFSLWYTTGQPNIFQYSFDTGLFTGYQPPFGGIGILNGLREIEMGRNGKLYIIQDEGANITVIENPDADLPVFSLIPIPFGTTGLGISDQIQSNLVNNTVFEQDTICATVGSTIILIPYLGGQYYWALSSAPNDIISISAGLPVTVPNTAVTYIATQLGSTNCFGGENQFLWTIHPKPNVLASGSGNVCIGGNAMLFGSPMTIGITSYYWTGPNGFLTTQQNPILFNVTSAASGTYSLTVFNTYGCNFTATTNITVLLAPSVDIISSTLEVCYGGDATLTAFSGSGTFLWNTGQTTSSIIVSPSATTLYSVTVTNAQGCTGSNSTTVSVIDIIPPSVSDVEICPGNSAILDAGAGYNAYQWSNGSTSQYMSANSQSSAIYTVTVTNALGCTAEDSAMVTILPLPLVEAGPNQSICNGQVANLTASGGVGYIWNNGQTTATITVQPTTTTTYTVTVTGANGCSSTNSVTITVLQPFTVSGLIGSDPNITCLDENTYNVAFTINGGIMPYWVNGELLPGNSYTSDWLTSSQYEFVLSDAQGCTYTISGNNSFCNVGCTVNALVLPIYNGACYEGFEVQILDGPPQPPAYLYSLNGVDFQMSPMFTGLPTGNYTVFLSTGCGTEIIGSYTQTTTTFNVSLSVESMANDLYFFQLDMSGGQMPYNIVWSSGDNAMSTIYHADNLPASVTVIDALGCQHFIEFTQSGAVGVAPVAWHDAMFSIYPNPVQDQFTVILDKALTEPVSITLYTLQGQIVLQKQSRFDLPEVFVTSTLPAGLYLIEIVGDQLYHTEKLMKR